MAQITSIEWAMLVWNVVTGCSKKSAGCKFCYAERMAARLQRMKNPRYKRGFEVTLHPDKLHDPKRWKSGRRIFVNSMSDLFHEEVPLEFLKQVFAVMMSCPQHQFLILTKRSERLREVAHHLSWPKNVWMGVSVEDSRVLSRVDDLRATPAQVKFLSCEPLIGSVAGINLEGIDWVIVGGESGPGARSMEQSWVVEVRDLCQAAGVAFFFKQWGGVRKDLTGRELDGRTYDEMPSS